MTAGQAVLAGLTAMRIGAPNAHIMTCGLPWVPTTTAQSLRLTGDIMDAIELWDEAVVTASGLLFVLGSTAPLMDLDYITDLGAR
jgi:hypothetical protein